MEYEAEGGMVIRGDWEREEAVEGSVLVEVVMCVVGEVEVEVEEEIELVVV